MNYSTISQQHPDYCGKEYDEVDFYKRIAGYIVTGEVFVRAGQRFVFYNKEY